MDLQTSVFLLFLLFTAGHSLRCHLCLSVTGSCEDQTVLTCPSEFSKCVSTTTASQGGVFSVKQKTKNCAADCANGSINYGLSKVSSVCCNTDQCNVQDAPDPSNVSNGKKCYSCDGKSCSKVMSCSGNEDRCFKATQSLGVLSTVVKGCVTKSLCNGPDFITSLSNISCCEGNLCNGAKSVTQSFLFLCCSLLCFILLR